MSNSARKQRVINVLTYNTKARNDYKLLICEVWKAEGCYTLDDVIAKGSAPQGILRDRRRKDVLERFPRDEAKEKAYKEYTEELSHEAGYENPWAEKRYV